MTDEEKQRAQDLLAKLEMATGELLAQDRRLSPTVTRMIEDLGALRSLLGFQRR